MVPAACGPAVRGSVPGSRDVGLPVGGCAGSCRFLLPHGEGDPVSADVPARLPLGISCSCCRVATSVVAGARRRITGSIRRQAGPRVAGTRSLEGDACRREVDSPWGCESASECHGRAFFETCRGARDVPVVSGEGGSHPVNGGVLVVELPALVSWGRVEVGDPSVLARREPADGGVGAGCGKGVAGVRLRSVRSGVRVCSPSRDGCPGSKCCAAQTRRRAAGRCVPRRLEALTGFGR